jgi:mono/diheme cytochrome c family protein
VSTLTLAIVLVALLLPALVLIEVWRTRQVAVPVDAPDTVVDPLLSTAGMSRKILFAMVALVEAFLLLVAYGANEPFRQSQAAERQLEIAQENGAHTFVTYCMACHGSQGQGYLQNVDLVGKPLNRSDLQSTDPDERKANIKLIYQTIENGRTGTPMPAWGDTNGGPLNYAMINELVDLIVGGRWDLVQKVVKDTGAVVPTESPITDPVTAGQKIVTQGPCAACHTIANTQAQGKVGPALDNIANRRIAGVLDFSTDNVKKWVTNPPANKPGTAMPPYALKEQYLDAIAAYLSTLNKPPS